MNFYESNGCVFEVVRTLLKIHGKLHNTISVWMYLLKYKAFIRNTEEIILDNLPIFIHPSPLEDILAFRIERYRTKVGLHYVIRYVERKGYLFWKFIQMTSNYSNVPLNTLRKGNYYLYDVRKEWNKNEK